MNNADVVDTPNYQLEYSRWVLELNETESSCFKLLYDGEAHYVGSIEVMNNGKLISVVGADWQFRQKQDRIEQWCQVQHTDTLSINMNYYFSGEALVIEYLARNSVPTRLDIRHVIQYLPKPMGHEVIFNSPPPWRHKREGLPSDFLSKTEKTDFFREAFSAKQWIVLEKSEPITVN